LAKAKKNENLLRGMDALYRDLDERFCVPVPHSTHQQEVAFVWQAISKYKPAGCYVLSAHAEWHQQTIGIMRHCNASSAPVQPPSCRLCRGAGPSLKGIR
jgi:hypothetical protein